MNEVNRHLDFTEIRRSMENALETGELGKVDTPLEHYHTEELYGRRIFVPAGTVVLTKVHKKEHITVALKGTCTVVDLRKNKTKVVAPAVFVTKPGTQRWIYAHDDVEWLTVHACEEQSIPNIEAMLVCDSFEELDREDYKKVLKAYNMTEAEAREMSENPRSQMMMPTHEMKTRIAPSKREGMGVFANEDIKQGERIGPVRVGYLRTPIGRYTNHSMNPNCEFNQCLDGLDAYATVDIAKDQEITVCYHAAREAGIEASRRLENRS